MEMTPTAEQQAVIDAAKTGDDLVIQAGAGTGKTSTLEMVAREVPKSSLYVAYNKAIATDASSRFPQYVRCKTSHSLAFGAVGRRFTHRLNSARQPSWEIAKDLGLGYERLDAEVQVSPSHQARIAADTVRRFCYSADDELKASHVPFQNGIVGVNHRKLTELILPLAKDWWADVQEPRGTMPFEHDHYLKMWALTRPNLGTDLVFLDEAQDSNPVLAKIVSDQDAQQIVVGDSCQQMYAWRGAVDALKGWGHAQQLYLSQSWRFGQVIADEANKWLMQLPTPLRLLGNPSIDSELADLDAPRAILCRTNGGAMGAVMSALEAGQHVALVGGGQALAKLAAAAADLRKGRKTNHPELYAFPDWESVVRYAREETSGKDLLPLVTLVNEHGAEKIIQATQALVNESVADVIVSTTHKAKGREWASVKVAGDFFAPQPAEGELPFISEGEAMVGYVAVTRAKQLLDRSGVAWIDDLVVDTEAEPIDVMDYVEEDEG